MSAASPRIAGALLLYRRPLSGFFADAWTVTDHIAAFGRYSRYPVYTHNTELGFPRGLRDVRFDAIILHYSLFGSGGEEYPFSPLFGRYLVQSRDSYKVAFFHDEHAFCGRRFAFLNRHRIDCVFTLLELSEFERVYGAYTEVERVVSHLPGYVSEHLVELAERLRIPDAERSIDVGFRARPLAPYMGPDDKTLIGEGFAQRAADRGLALDIDVSPRSLLAGEDWYRFVADCRTILGAESGAACFDLEDEVYREYEHLAADRSDVTIEDLRGGALERWTDRVHYRTIGPRNFEAAALGVCQVLFEGRYSDVMEPGRHYIELHKDFSNLDQVVEQIRDPERRRELTANARRDLIASGDYGYRRLMARFDGVLADAGVRAAGELNDAGSAQRALRRSHPTVAAQRVRSTLSYHPVLRRALWRVSRTVLGSYRRARRRWVERADGA